MFLENLQYDDCMFALSVNVASSATSYNGKKSHITRVQKWL